MFEDCKSRQLSLLHWLETKCLCHMGSTYVSNFIKVQEQQVTRTQHTGIKGYRQFIGYGVAFKVQEEKVFGDDDEVDDLKVLKTPYNVPEPVKTDVVEHTLTNCKPVASSSSYGAFEMHTAG